jgi:hypothetical protein
VEVKIQVSSQAVQVKSQVAQVNLQLAEVKLRVEAQLQGQGQPALSAG